MEIIERRLSLEHATSLSEKVETGIKTSTTTRPKWSGVGRLTLPIETPSQDRSQGPKKVEGTLELPLLGQSSSDNVPTRIISVVSESNVEVKLC